MPRKTGRTRRVTERERAKTVNDKTTGKEKASVKPTKPKTPAYNLISQTVGVPANTGKPKPGTADRSAERRAEQLALQTIQRSVKQAVHEALQPLASQIKILRQETAKKDAEIMALKQELARVEAEQKAQANTYHVPQSLAEMRPRRQPPAGMTAMQAIMGQLDVEETTEELLTQLKALD